MSNDEDFRFEVPRSRNGTDTVLGRELAAEEKRHDLRQDIDAASARSARSTYWLKFAVGGLVGLLIALLYDRYIGLPQRPCPPCPRS